MSAATWTAVSVTLDMVTDVAMDIIVDRAFAPYLIEHEVEIRNVFVDDEYELIKRLRFIEWSNDLNWGAQQ